MREPLWTISPPCCILWSIKKRWRIEKCILGVGVGAGGGECISVDTVVVGGGWQSHISECIGNFFKHWKGLYYTPYKFLLISHIRQGNWMGHPIGSLILFVSFLIKVALQKEFWSLLSEGGGSAKIKSFWVGRGNSMRGVGCIYHFFPLVVLMIP